MLGDSDDPLALEHESPECQAVLREYVDGKIEIEEAERKIDYLIGVGEEGARRHEEESEEEWARTNARLAFEAMKEADIERNRLKAIARWHRSTPAMEIERVADAYQRRSS